MGHVRERGRSCCLIQTLHKLRPACRSNQLAAGVFGVVRIIEASGHPPPQKDVGGLVPLHSRGEAVVPARGDSTRRSQRGSVRPAQEATARSPDEPPAAVGG